MYFFFLGGGGRGGGGILAVWHKAWVAQLVDNK
jgi:hypothetical protein